MKELKFCYRYPHPAVAVDCVIFGYDGSNIKVLLIQRKNYPYKTSWAFPGGFINMNETAEEAACRELEEETGLKGVVVRQLYTYTDIERDPRERVISIAHYALTRITEVKAGDDAKNVRWFPLNEIPNLAFDHDIILNKALNTLKERIYFEPIVFELLSEVFKMSELQNVYEKILGIKFDRRNFYKKMNKLEILTEVEGRAKDTSRRIPIYYRFNAERYAELKQKGFKLEF
jgi:8-oxo-dGTP diphosphatase